MPRLRDIRVPRNDHQFDAISNDDAINGVDIDKSRSSPELVTVMGFGKGDVLFRSDRANVIQVRDGSGSIACMLIRIKPGIWGFSKRGDDDWTEVLGIYGNDDQGA